MALQGDATPCMHLLQATSPNKQNVEGDAERSEDVLDARLIDQTNNQKASLSRLLHRNRTKTQCTMRS